MADDDSVGTLTFEGTITYKSHDGESHQRIVLEPQSFIVDNAGESHLERKAAELMELSAHRTKHGLRRVPPKAPYSLWEDVVSEQQRVVELDPNDDAVVERLDDAVHQMASQVASDINNAEEWVDYLLSQGMSADEINKIIRGESHGS